MLLFLLLLSSSSNLTGLLSKAAAESSSSYRSALPKLTFFLLFDADIHETLILEKEINLYMKRFINIIKKCLLDRKHIPSHMIYNKVWGGVYMHVCLMNE